MTKKFLFTTMATVTVIASLGVAIPTKGFASIDANFQLNSYLPAPPGVQIHMEADRPYYIENNKRVYVERIPNSRRGKQRGNQYGKLNEAGEMTSAETSSATAKTFRSR